MYKQIVIATSLIAFVVQTSAVSAANLVSMKQIYNYAEKQDINFLKSIKNQLETLDSKGNTAVCQAILNEDIKTYNTLIRAGANANATCIKNIPQSAYNNFMTSVAQSGMAGGDVATTGAVATTTAGTTATASTGTFLGMGALGWGITGAVVAAGGVAAAAGGGGGGGGGSAPAPNPCSGITCGTNASCSAGSCVCNSGYEGDADTACTLIPLDCHNGNQTGTKCTCDEGWTGSDCTQPVDCGYTSTSCDEGYTATGNTCKSGANIYTECVLNDCSNYQVTCGEGYNSTQSCLSGTTPYYTCTPKPVPEGYQLADCGIGYYEIATFLSGENVYHKCEIKPVPDGYTTSPCSGGYEQEGETFVSGITNYYKCKAKTVPEGYQSTECGDGYGQTATFLSGETLYYLCEEKSVPEGYQIDPCGNGYKQTATFLSGTTIYYQCAPTDVPDGYTSTPCSGGYEQDGETFISGTTNYYKCKAKTVPDGYTSTPCSGGYEQDGETFISGETHYYKCKEKDCSKYSSSCNEGYVATQSCLSGTTPYYTCTPVNCGSGYTKGNSCPEGYLQEGELCLSGEDNYIKCIPETSTSFAGVSKDNTEVVEYTKINNGDLYGVYLNVIPGSTPEAETIDNGGSITLNATGEDVRITGLYNETPDGKIINTGDVIINRTQATSNLFDNSIITGFSANNNSDAPDVYNAGNLVINNNSISGSINGIRVHGKSYVLSNSGSQEETGVSGVIDITNTGNSSITGISTNYDNSTGSRLITNAFVSSESSVVATTEGSININNASSNEDEGTPNIYGMLGDTAEGTIINSGSDLIGNNQTVNGTININNANSHVQNIYGIKGRKEILYNAYLKDSSSGDNNLITGNILITNNSNSAVYGMNGNAYNAFSEVDNVGSNSEINGNITINNTGNGNVTGLTGINSLGGVGTNGNITITNTGSGTVYGIYSGLNQYGDGEGTISISGSGTKYGIYLPNANKVRELYNLASDTNIPLLGNIQLNGHGTGIYINSYAADWTSQAWQHGGTISISGTGTGSGTGIASTTSIINGTSASKGQILIDAVDTAYGLTGSGSFVNYGNITITNAENGYGMYTNNGYGTSTTTYANFCNNGNINVSASHAIGIYSRNASPISNTSTMTDNYTNGSGSIILHNSGDSFMFNHGDGLTNGIYGIKNGTDGRTYNLQTRSEYDSSALIQIDDTGKNHQTYGIYSNLATNAYQLNMGVNQLSTEKKATINIHTTQTSAYGIYVPNTGTQFEAINAYTSEPQATSLIGNHAPSNLTGLISIRQEADMGAAGMYMTASNSTLINAQYNGSGIAYDSGDYQSTTKGIIEILNEGSGTSYGMFSNGEMNNAVISSTNGQKVEGIIKMLNLTDGTVYGMNGQTAKNLSTENISSKILISNLGTGNAMGIASSNAINSGLIQIKRNNFVTEGNESYVADNGRGGKSYGMYTTNRAINWENSGKIEISAASSGYGMYSYKNAPNTEDILVNSGTIEISDVDTGAGILYCNSGRGTITNSGTITVSGTNVYGIYFKGDSTVNNEGIINVSGTNAFGIYHEGAGGTIINSGTITVNGNEWSGTNVNETGSPIIVLNGSTLINANLVSAKSFNTASLGGNVITTANSKWDIANEFSGPLGVSANLTTQGFNTTYVAKDMINAGDTSGLQLKSQSALFDASLADNGHDVVMKMKGFETVTDNSSFAQFLATNYALGQNEAFFNTLKEIGSMSALTNSLDKMMGKEMLSRFAFEDMTMMRELNFDMNNNLFNNKESYFSMGGSVSSPMAFRGDNGSNSRYSLSSKSDGTWSVGLGVAFTDIRSDDDNDDNSRSDTMYQMIMPIGYKAAGFKFMISPRVGYARGNYDRTGFDNKSYDGTIEKRIFGLMNEARYPITVGKWKFEPSVEFNALGYEQKGWEDKKEYSLVIPKQKTYSVESGIGLYMTRETELSKDSKFKLTAGISAYHEFADPYKMDVGMNGMTGHFTLRDEKRSDNRAVARAGFDYNQKDYSLYGSFISYVDKEVRSKANLGFKWKF